jgi:hypothetical protein
MLYDDSLHTIAMIDIPGLIENQLSIYPCNQTVSKRNDIPALIDAVNDQLGARVGVPGQTRCQHPSVANDAGITPTGVRRWNYVHNAASWFSPAQGDGEHDVTVEHFLSAHR